MCMHGKSSTFDARLHPLPQLRGMLPGDDGTERFPAAACANGLLERHAMDRPRRETRIRVETRIVETDAGRMLPVAYIWCAAQGRSLAVIVSNCSGNMISVWTLALDMAVGTPGVPRGELDGVPDGAPLTRPSAAGVSCRQTRSARRPRRNSTYRHARADWMRARSPPHKSCAAAGIPRGERRLTARRRSNGRSTGAAGLPCRASDTAGCRSSFGSPRGTFGVIRLRPWVTAVLGADWPQPGFCL
jgi:hypothetical protein